MLLFNQILQERLIAKAKNQDSKCQLYTQFFIWGQLLLKKQWDQKHEGSSKTAKYNKARSNIPNRIRQDFLDAFRHRLLNVSTDAKNERPPPPNSSLILKLRPIIAIKISQSNEKKTNTIKTNIAIAQHLIANGIRVTKIEDKSFNKFTNNIKK